MRRLPICPDPKNGESLSGYMLRLSDLYGLPPGDISTTIGYHPKEKEFRTRRSGYRLTEKQKLRIATATGISLGRLISMTLEYFDGKLFKADLTKQMARGVPSAIGKRVSIWDTAFCPRCLEEDRTFLINWQSRWSLVCVKHGTVLVEACPKCGNPESTLKRPNWPKDADGVLRDITCCWRSGGRGHDICRYPLSQAPAADVSADADLLIAQETINDIVDGLFVPTLAGVEISPPAFFSDLSAFMYLVRLEEQVKSGNFERRDGPSQSSFGLVQHLWPRKAKRELLVRALRMAATESQDELVNSIRDIGDLAYKEGNVRLPQRRAFPGLLEPFGRILNHARGVTCYANAVQRAGMDRIHHRRPNDLPEQMELRHVPQLFWRAEYENKLEHFFDGLDFSWWRARRLCSVLLGRMLQPLDWEQAAFELGFPSDSYKHKAIWVSFSAIVAAGRDTELLDAIRRIAAERFTADEAIDYRYLQVRLSRWEGVDETTYSYLTDDKKPAKHHVDHIKRRSFASTIIWSEIVQSDDVLSPFWRARGPYEMTLFKHTFLHRQGKRIEMLQEIVRTNPDSSIRLHLGMLIGDLDEVGEISPRFRRHHLEGELIQRTLRHVSAHTGVDIPSIVRPHHTNNRPAGEIHARLLTAHILYRLGGSYWDEVKAVLNVSSNSRCNVDDKGFQRKLLTMKSLDYNRETLIAAVRDGRGIPPDPSGPEPHRTRMEKLGRQIGKETLLLAIELGVEEREAVLLSQFACKKHTDLSDSKIAEVFGGNMAFRFVSWSHGRESIPNHLDRSARIVLDRAAEIRRAVGYENAYFGRGITGPSKRHLKPAA